MLFQLSLCVCFLLNALCLSNTAAYALQVCKSDPVVAVCLLAAVVALPSARFYSL
jgi:hypothetical protein